MNPISESFGHLSVLCGDVKDLPDEAIPLRWFEQCVQRDPMRVAIYAGPHRVTYAHLDCMAGNVARRIRTDGRFGVVGVLLDRSVELVASLYGVQKAGAAYLPLDLASPTERLKGIINDAKLEVIITSSALAPRLVGVTAQLVLVDEIDWFDERPVPNVMIDDSHAAYIIYTSGSTGTPKGVAVSHRSLWNRLDWMQCAYPIDASDRVLQKTPYTFDVSVWEFFWPLMYGASMVILPPEQHKDAALLLNFVERTGVTVMHFVPSMLDVMLDFCSPGRCESLRRVFCSGEALSHKLIERFEKQFGQCRLVNLYGPTEAAIDVTFWDCQSGYQATTPPIGKPISNTQCWILNESGQPVPRGVEGELHLSGIGLAIGYLNSDELTRRAFIHPGAYLPAQVSRLYKTGDIARVLPDGNIEYLGRRDHQIKIRGMRVELGEIEHVLEQAVGIIAVRILLHDDRLVAFVKASTRLESEGTVALRQFASSKLPDHMVPHRFVQVEAMPMLSNGKTDREALRRLLSAPTQAQEPETVFSSAAPEGENLASVELMRRIWSDTLCVPIQDIHEESQFFELGGDSIAMLKVLARCKSAGLALSLGQFNAHPVLGQLCRVEPLAAAAPARHIQVVETRVAGDSVAATETAAVAAVMRRVWAEVLKIPERDIHYGAGFFDLGGDSIAMLKAVAKCTRLGVPISLAQFNRATVFGELVRLLEGESPEPIGGLETASSAPWPVSAISVTASSDVLPKPPVAGLCEAMPHPVTAFQQDLLDHVFLGQDLRYVLQHRMRLGGDVGVDSLIAGWRQVVARHEILCSRYRRQEMGQKFVRVADGEADADFLPGKLTEAEWNEFCEELVAQPFQLEIAAPLRLRIARVGTGVVAIVVTHHLILDGTSFAMVLHEWLSLAAALEVGRSFEANPVAPTYRDYERWICEQNRAEALAHWRRMLHGWTASPLERHSDKMAGAEVHQIRRQLSIPSAARHLLARHGISLSTAMNFAFGAVLSRYCGERRVVWGNAVSLRPVAVDGADRIVGPCLSSVPVTGDFGEDVPFFDWLRSLQLQVLEARQHGHVGLAAIAEAHGAGNLFDALFTFQTTPAAKADANAMALGVKHDPGELSSHYALTLSVMQRGADVELFLAYQSGCFDHHQAADFLLALDHVVSCLASWEHVAVRDIDALRAESAEIARISSDLTGPIGPQLPADWCLQRFLEHARATPANVAVLDADGGGQWSYAELDSQSNRVANALVSHSTVGAVGVALPRSPWMIAVVLGILKAGCSVVCVDLEMPGPRLEWIAREAALQAVVGEAADAEFLAKLSPLTLTVGDFESMSDEYDFRGFASGEQLCTINYTSGSTGVPKLVRVSHGSHANRLAWLATAFPATLNDTYCLKTRLEFAPALREILEPLTQGARLFLMPTSANTALERFLSLVHQFEVTRLFVTPSFARVVLDSDSVELLSRVEVLEISGEPVPRDLVNHLASRLPRTRLYNRYGTTEGASLVYQALDVCAVEGVRGSVCPVGTPIRNSRCVVLDRHGRVAPRGCIGDILLFSPSIALGYTDAQASADAFFRGENGWRGFRTGDHGWVDAQGRLNYSGRATRMIKRSGFRIEPREIEVSLEQSDLIARCVLFGRQSPAGQRLTAFVTASRPDEDPLTSLDVRRIAESRLPGYLLPNDYVVLSAIPVTSSGKVDFVALASLAEQRHESAVALPANATEAFVLEVFRAVMRDDAIHAESDFFAHGGDSLLALRIVHEINRHHGTRLDVSALYLAPSPRAISLHLQPRREEGDNTIMALTHGDKGAQHLLFAFPPAGGGAHSYNEWRQSLAPGLALHVLAPVALNSLPEDQADKLTLMAARFAEFVVDTAAGRPFALAGWSLGGTLAYAVACRLRDIDQTPSHVFLIDPGLPQASYDNGLDEEEIIRLFEGNQQDILGGTEERQAIAARLLADARLIRTFRPARYDGALHLFKPEQTHASERNFGQPFNGLEAHHDGDLTLHRVPGNHVTMMTNWGGLILETIQRELFNTLP